MSAKTMVIPVEKIKKATQTMRDSQRAIARLEAEFETLYRELALAYQRIEEMERG